MTYSIAARCAETGQLGVAVQSHYFGVGRLVPWVRAGVGAIATQSFVEVRYGREGLERLSCGETPADALAAMAAADDGQAGRQVGMVDASGRTAVHTGASCVIHAGHVVGDGFSAQANMMRGDGVPQAMASAFETTAGPLWFRLLAALDAAEAAGGDIRGRQSAALVIAGPDDRDVPSYDVRVEDHPDPLVELRRLATLADAYRRLDAAETALVAGDLDTAVAGYESVTADVPDHDEFRFWQAVALASAGRVALGAAAIAPVLAGVDGAAWTTLLRRLPGAGLASDAAVAGLVGGMQSAEEI